MIFGFNTAPVAMRPPPLCSAGDESIYNVSESCDCSPRNRSSSVTTIYTDIKRDSVVRVARGILSLVCDKPDKIVWANDQPTPEDVECRPFIKSGDGYVKFINGIIGHEFELILWTNDGSSTYDDKLTLNFRIVA